MKTYNINDNNYINTDEYQNFIRENPGTGYLKIRAYAASQAVPIDGLIVVVSKVIGNDKVIFFEGVTNESGIIERISLPAPKLDPNDLDVPNKITYDINVTYNPNNISSLFKINIYENIRVVQNIGIVPEMMVSGGDI